MPVWISTMFHQIIEVDITGAHIVSPDMMKKVDNMTYWQDPLKEVS